MPEIKEYVQLFATSAKTAVEKAGFDGIEILAANGYIIMQFLHESATNMVMVATHRKHAKQIDS